MGALAATGQATRKYMYEPLGGGFLHVRPPDNYRRPEGMSIEEFNLLHVHVEIEERIFGKDRKLSQLSLWNQRLLAVRILVPDPDLL